MPRFAKSSFLRTLVFVGTIYLYSTLVQQQSILDSLMASVVTTEGDTPPSTTFVSYEAVKRRVSEKAKQIRDGYRTVYSKATVVTQADPWFRPKRICTSSCCAETVAISIDQDDTEIVNSVQGLDLADVVLQHYSAPPYLHFFPPTMSDDILPCLQPGTIIHLDNHATILDYFFYRLRPNITVPYILITGESDADSPQRENYAKQLATDKLLIKWYGSNPNKDLVNAAHGGHDKFEPFPLGLSKHHRQNPYLSEYLKLTNFTNPFHDKSKWTSRLGDLDAGEETTSTLFSFFGIHAYAKHRQSLHDTICKGRKQMPRDNVTCSSGKLHHSPEDVYAAASTYLFGLSPPGAGWDCYRTYELLLLGVVPIIERRPGSDELFQGLPVIHVDALVQNVNRTQHDFVSMMRDYITSDEFQQSNFTGWERLFMGHWRRKLLLESGRLGDIVSDEHGRKYYQAWRYTKMTERHSRTLCSIEGNCQS